MIRRSEYVTVMMPKEMKLMIQEIASKHMWTISQTVYVILCDYFANNGQDAQENK